MPDLASPALDGYDYEECIVEEKNGKLSISYEGKNGLQEILNQKVAFKIKFKGYRLWSIEGDIEMAEHRLWEGFV